MDKMLTKVLPGQDLDDKISFIGEGTVVDPQLYVLLEKARTVVMTPADRAEQRISFAYGNAHLENDAITRELIREAAARVDAANAKGQ